MKIHAISDLHGHFPELPGGDLLIVAGDISIYGTKGEIMMVSNWLDKQQYEKIIVIGGNHDTFLTTGKPPFRKAEYLDCTATSYQGIKIWASPYTPKFGSWGFMRTEDRLQYIWDVIPSDTEILITHGPPRGILDKNDIDQNCGCRTLRNALNRIQPKLHIFGHIHESYGHTFLDGTHFYNVSTCDETYEPVNPVTEIEWPLNLTVECAIT